MSEEKKDRDIKDYLNDILEKIADIDAFDLNLICKTPRFHIA